MKLMISGVIFSAATVRSPSFSRSSSSTTMIMRPSRNASMASAMGANGDFRRGGLLGTMTPTSRRARRREILHRAQHVLAENIALDIDGVADLQLAQVG